jgi:hypothetical protein
MITFGWKAGRIASKLGLTPYRRLRLGIKYEIAKKKFGNKVFDIKKHIKKHPIKYTAAGSGVTGYGIGKVNSNKKKGWV